MPQLLRLFSASLILIGLVLSLLATPSTSTLSKLSRVLAKEQDSNTLDNSIHGKFVCIFKGWEDEENNQNVNIATRVASKYYVFKSTVDPGATQTSANQVMTAFETFVGTKDCTDVLFASHGNARGLFFHNVNGALRSLSFDNIYARFPAKKVHFAACLCQISVPGANLGLCENRILMPAKLGNDEGWISYDAANDYTVDVVMRIHEDIVQMLRASNGVINTSIKQQLENIKYIVGGQMDFIHFAGSNLERRNALA